MASDWSERTRRRVLRTAGSIATLAIAGCGGGGGGGHRIAVEPRNCYSDVEVTIEQTETVRIQDTDRYQLSIEYRISNDRSAAIEAVAFMHFFAGETYQPGYGTSSDYRLDAGEIRQGSDTGPRVPATVDRCVLEVYEDGDSCTTYG